MLDQRNWDIFVELNGSTLTVYLRLAGKKISYQKRHNYQGDAHERKKIFVHPTWSLTLSNIRTHMLLE